MGVHKGPSLRFPVVKGPFGRIPRAIPGPFHVSFRGAVCPVCLQPAPEKGCCTPPSKMRPRHSPDALFFEQAPLVGRSFLPPPRPSTRTLIQRAVAEVRAGHRAEGGEHRFGRLRRALPSRGRVERGPPKGAQRGPPKGPSRGPV
ncbi:hypothetical protein M885DRAFT_292732 [Pelagophyceae sp. CCMP2097]|nr:hypothetical protein M885DRAFT_292732 [Pelagophyceae sp. CCMP2097]